ncbi:hypothetical protein [Ferrimonas marina]|uniref:Uncharacterized protein n=1 Tax=Ferrimonas marina TaxID=299255 RepID=A0A1M5TZN8_9GAMM|nr:hypothetical protein [Ferrimonas marina]SHH56168.1 hypothetical protein SAMN02745129_2343 [Ferrimonas marina]
MNSASEQLARAMTIRRHHIQVNTQLLLVFSLCTLLNLCLAFGWSTPAVDSGTAALYMTLAALTTTAANDLAFYRNKVASRRERAAAAAWSATATVLILTGWVYFSEYAVAYLLFIAAPLPALYEGRKNARVHQKMERQIAHFEAEVRKENAQTCATPSA